MIIWLKGENAHRDRYSHTKRVAQYQKRFIKDLKKLERDGRTSKVKPKTMYIHGFLSGVNQYEMAKSANCIDEYMSAVNDTTAQYAKGGCPDEIERVCHFGLTQGVASAFWDDRKASRGKSGKK